MRPDTQQIVCSPLERAPLRVATVASPDGGGHEFLVNQALGLRFPIRNGIPDFIVGREITGINGRFRRIYDAWAPFYDLLSRVGLYILGVSELKLRRDFVASLEIGPRHRVLATSVGTGSDLPFLPRDCDFHGLDQSPEMLRICQKKVRKLGADAQLYVGQAEALPFKDASFDMVYQMGGINFFGDPAKAIHEMIRVAKGGSKIVIMDETEKVARRLEHVPGIRAWFRHHQRPIVPPIELIPAGMQQLEYRELYNGQAWYLSFRTPS
jgi:ubiquinone/menaquinone biosynthesis C-methylase UbiE/uncharacterized protein YbaR (Trm112 family)